MSRGTEGFAMTPRWLAQAEEVTIYAKAVYLVLASYVDRHGQAFPGQQRLAREAGCSLRKVRDALAELRALGVLTWETTWADNGAQTLNTYTLSHAQRPHPPAHGAAPPAPDAAPKPSGSGENQGRHTVPDPPAHGAAELEPVERKETKGRARTAATLEQERAKASADVRALVQSMRDLLERQNGDVPRLTAEWYQQMRLCVGEHDAPAVDATMRWALADSFWAGVVLSPAKLRRHWDSIRAQMARRPAREQDERPDPYAEQDRREQERLESWLSGLGVTVDEWEQRKARSAPEDLAWRDGLLARSGP